MRVCGKVQLTCTKPNAAPQTGVFRSHENGAARNEKTAQRHFGNLMGFEISDAQITQQIEIVEVPQNGIGNYEHATSSGSQARSEQGESPAPQSLVR